MPIQTESDRSGAPSRVFPKRPGNGTVGPNVIDPASTFPMCAEKDKLLAQRRFPTTTITLPPRRPSTPSQAARPSPSYFTLPMQPSFNMSEIAFHSPSSQIVGTPFATTSTPFEYPFPDTSSDSSSSSAPSLHATAVAPAAATLSVLNNVPISTTTTSSFPALSASPPQSQSQTASAPALSLAFPSTNEIPHYNPTHPKMKSPANPPVPPGLAKKRMRWSLNLLSMRRTSYGTSSDSSSSSGVLSPGSTLSNGTPSPEDSAKRLR